MYAIVQSGSRQFQVKKGDLVHVDLLDAEVGQDIELKEVLMIAQEDGSVLLGKPTILGSFVKAHYVAEVKGPKVYGMKYKQRKNERRKFGHRQRYAQLRITDICQ